MIRHRFTREFFSHGGWTPDPHLAESFENHAAAREARDRHQLSNVELYYMIGAVPSPVFDFSIPLPDGGIFAQKGSKA